MSPRPAIPVGIRLPLATDRFSPAGLLRVCEIALDLGYSSFWVPDHVLVPAATASAHPYSPGGRPPFHPDAPWADPFLELTWLAAHLPEARFGTAVLVLTLRNPVLLAKQLSTMSWLTERPFSFGVGSGWMREEYDAVGARFEKRAARANQDLAHIRELLERGQRTYSVRGQDDELIEQQLKMLPRARAPVQFLWGGVSRTALRLVASSCDGWLPSKQTMSSLERHLRDLRAACDETGRNFDELRIVAKAGPGLDPPSGAIERDNIAGYAEMGVHELILELPYEPDGVAEAATALERIARRSWL
jgi:alkanesulfonate monooxygenase SsuD/methylene tetrahydromethanopterin reductase-like flavin-dependent oxidoreductase (luciferase family)